MDELSTLRSEVVKLRLEVKRLRNNEMKHCRGCANMTRHSCYTLGVCPYLGIVDPDVDGCSRRKEYADE